MLSNLLDAEEPTFSLAIRDLEEESGRTSADLKLLSEIIGRVRVATEQLGLDPDDTKPKELYYALIKRVEQDNRRIIKEVLKMDYTENVRDLVPAMVKIVKNTKIPQDCWALKRSVAKKLLKKMPPKQMMKHLGYRSIDSMLKKEPFDEMYSALRFSEGGKWLDRFNNLLKTVKPSDFETRKIQIIEMNHDKWVGLAGDYTKKKLHNVTHTKEMGTIIVVPMHVETMRGLPLKTMSLLFHYINEVRLYSAFFKLKSTKPKFGKMLVDTIAMDPSNASIIAGTNIHWRVIAKYFGKLKDEKHPEAFQPHVQPEDLHWRKAEEVLYDLDPNLEFWQDLDYVAIETKTGPVALNFMDIAFAFSNGETYEDRYYYHFREALWNEVFIRYMGEANLEEQVLKELDNDVIKPERLDPK